MKRAMPVLTLLAIAALLIGIPFLILDPWPAKCTEPGCANRSSPGRYCAACAKPRCRAHSFPCQRDGCGRMNPSPALCAACMPGHVRMSHAVAWRPEPAPHPGPADEHAKETEAAEDAAQDGR